MKHSNWRGRAATATGIVALAAFLTSPRKPMSREEEKEIYHHLAIQHAQAAHRQQEAAMAKAEAIREERLTHDIYDPLVTPTPEQITLSNAIIDCYDRIKKPCARHTWEKPSEDVSIFIGFTQKINTLPPADQTAVIGRIMHHAGWGWQREQKPPTHSKKNTPPHESKAMMLIGAVLANCPQAYRITMVPEQSYDRIFSAPAPAASSGKPASETTSIAMQEAQKYITMFEEIKAAEKLTHAKTGKHAPSHHR